MSVQREWPAIRWRATGEPRRILVEDFSVEVDGAVLTVPAGFDDFDGASIPRWLWGSVGHPFMREFERAALIHDYFYGNPESRRRHNIDSRAKIDSLFYELLLEDGVDRPKAKRMHWAVERFGASRFAASGAKYVTKTREELAALDAQDCECAEGEVRDMLEAGGEDPELLHSLREIDWGIIKGLF